MEITKETKIRLFAQYLGCKVEWMDESAVPFQRKGQRRFNLPDGFGGVSRNIDHYALVLKPLSSITDEDAIELASIHKWKELWKEDGYMDEEAINRSLIEKGNDMVTTELFKLPIKGYQFLQSKGYDLPQYLLGGATLKEAGLAIYE